MANVLGTLFTDIANSIRSKTGSTDKISPSEFPSQIDSIQGGGGDIPTGYKTVTFMNGDNVIFERFVLSGDDCPDPLTQGRIETPTKESSDQYHFTYKGWGTTDGGTANSSVLKNITEDKVIYSIYTETVRNYTITYYDTDGVTVVGSEILPYGATAPVVGGKKEGYYAGSYIPEFAPVTGDASYTVVWTESVSFATGNWADIANACDRGLASKNFAVGDTRTETINGKDYTLEIIGINHDTVYSTGATTGITVWIKNYDVKNAPPAFPYLSSGFHTTIEEGIFDLLDSNLQSAIKEVSKQYFTSNTGNYDIRTGGARIWSLSLYEINNSRDALGYEKEGKPYEKFSTSKTGGTSYTYDDIKTGQSYWLRSVYYGGWTSYVSSTGYIYRNTTSSTKYYVCPCFCI